jgi:hypothetical protein
MVYKRKTKDEWQLHINYGYGDGFEHEVSEETLKEIKLRSKEYQENCPQYTRKIIRKRVKLDV